MNCFCWGGGYSIKFYWKIFEFLVLKNIVYVYLGYLNFCIDWKKNYFFLKWKKIKYYIDSLGYM